MNGSVHERVPLCVLDPCVRLIISTRNGQLTQERPADDLLRDASIRHALRNVGYMKSDTSFTEAERKRVRERWDYHASTPHISADDHERRRRLALTEEIKPRTKVYLDQNFWIDLVRAREGRSGPTEVALLETLQMKVAQGTIVCPAGEAVFAELMKNRSMDARLQVAALVEELSCGVAIQNVWDRVHHEFAAVMLPDKTIPPREYVWTKLPFIYGHPRPQPKVPPETLLIMQKGFFDTMWYQPFTEIVQLAGDDLRDTRDYETTASRINDDSIQFEHELKSYQDAFEAEARGSAFHLQDAEILKILRDVGASQGVPYPDMTQKQRSDLISMARHIVGTGLANRTPAAVDKMRSLMVMTCLHATFRWDMKNSGKNRKGGRTTIKGNDLFDFDHAAAAIGYCDYFFTERQLYRRLTRPEVGIETIYPCKPAFGVEAALEIARSL